MEFTFVLDFPGEKLYATMNSRVDTFIINLFISSEFDNSLLTTIPRWRGCKSSSQRRKLSGL